MTHGLLSMRRCWPASTAALLLLGAFPALAQTPLPAEPETREQQPSAPEDAETKGDLFNRDRLLGALG